jgi:hypothetical protein
MARRVQNTSACQLSWRKVVLKNLESSPGPETNEETVPAENPLDALVAPRIPEGAARLSQPKVFSRLISAFDLHR